MSEADERSARMLRQRMLRSREGARFSHGGWIVVLPALVLVYLVAFGGTTAGELIPQLWVVNALIGASLLVNYALHAPRAADRIDKLIVAAVVLVCVSNVFSRFPRDSFDAVLLAITCAAGFFFARGIAAEPIGRGWIVGALLFLSAVLTAVTALRWGATAGEWMSIAGGGLLPPLNLELPSFPYGHRHDLALVVAMLYPAWWMGRPSKPKAVAATACGLLALFVVVIDGSRTLWAAMFLAAIVAFGPMLLGRRPSARATSLLAVGLIAGAVLVAAVTGLAPALIDRAFNLSSAGFRGAMWVALVGWWPTSPLLGGGLGSFYWLLHETGYFDAASFSPRHPDSAPFQLLAEGGVAGLLAAGLVIVAVAPSLLRSDRRGAVWAVLVFAIASLSSNPSDFPFVLAVAATWTALAIPRDPPEALAQRPRTQPMQVAAYLAIAVAGLAYLSTAVAGASYLEARTAAAAGDLDAAESALSRSVALDPSMPLYWRERGALHLTEGRISRGLADLRRAVVLNPSDEVSWRRLAVARRNAGDREGAYANLARAIQLRRSDPRNLLLLATWKSEDGETVEAQRLLTEVVQAWPEITGSLAWPMVVNAMSVDSKSILEGAAIRWADGRPAPEAIADQGVWLAILSGREDLLDRALLGSGYPAAFTDLAAEVMRCGSIGSELAALPPEVRRVPHFWVLRLRDAGLAGLADHDAEWMVLAGSGEDVWAPGEPTTALESPPSHDRWGYGRLGIDWDATDLTLPGVEGGFARWALEPRRAAEDAGLGEVLPRCSD